MSKRIFEIVQDINGRVGLHWDDEDKHELAELIVRECADKCLAMAYVAPGPHHYAAMIKEHFGVKE
jgi:hypothetical protein